MFRSFVILKRNAIRLLRNVLTIYGAFSLEQNFIRGDPDGVIQWINSEAKAFEEILSDRGTFVPLPVPAELCRSLRRLAGNMPRLWFSQDSHSQPTILETLRPKPLH